MAQIDVSRGGSLKIGTYQVNRLGFGAMRITGEGIWGQPKNLDEAKRVLKRAPQLGVNFIDTADSYGPHVSENLIAEMLAPYGTIVVATKGGFVRPGPNNWVANGRPDYLRACVKESLVRLRLERIPLWQLHRIDSKVPRDEQFAVIAEMQKAGLIEHVGLSEVSIQEIQAASKYFTVATVQNQYNIIDRKSEAVLDYCTAEGIGFIPWYPLAAGSLSEPGGILDTVANTLDATPSQIALAWLLKRSPVMLPIPGTGSVIHLEENCAAVNFHLSDAEFAAIDDAGRKAFKL
jgi:pyridoxine 4-dehydrogenase